MRGCNAEVLKLLPSGKYKEVDLTALTEAVNLFEKLDVKQLVDAGMDSLVQIWLTKGDAS